jgi:hypothetical protein
MPLGDSVADYLKTAIARLESDVNRMVKKEEMSVHDGGRRKTGLMAYVLKMFVQIHK